MRRTGSNSGLFLLEMILVIFFFAMTAAIYVRVFADARATDRQSAALTEAILVAQNLAEAFYASDGDAARIHAFLPDDALETTDGDAQTFTVRYDGRWETLPASEDENAVYAARLRLSEQAPYRVAEIAVFDEESDVYTLSLRLYPRADKGGAP